MKRADRTVQDRVGVRWTAKSVGSHFGHKFFYLVIRYGGRRPAYFFLSFITLFYVVFVPSVRKKSGYYISRRFKGKAWIGRLADTYLLCLNLGRALIDRAVIGILGTEKITMEFRNQGVLFDLLGEGKGLILMTAHVGCWQAAMATIKSLNAPVNLLIQREEGDIDLHYFEHAGMDCPFKIIDPRGYMGGVLEMMNALKQKEVLSVMGDRLFGSEKGAVAVDFLGDDVLFPFSSFKIASATGAPVAVLFSVKSGPDRYTLYVARVIRVPFDAGKKERDCRSYVKEFVRALEAYTEAHPYQFFNFYDMWGAGSPYYQKKD